MTRRALWECLAMLALLPTLSGCGYQVGVVIDEDPNLLLVAVEPFANRTQPYEPFIETRLHQAVLDQIMRGPYQLTNPENADLYVTGAIILFRQNVLSQDVNNDPTEIQLSIQVQMLVRELRGSPPRKRPVETLSPVSEPFVLERGETLADAADRAYRSLARQIVEHFTHPERRLDWNQELDAAGTG